MSFFDGLSAGFSYAVAPSTLLVVAIGTLIGILVGAAPGLGPNVGMAVVLPVAIHLPADSAVVLLVAILVGANYGNSFPAVLISVPGTPGAILTVTEGYPFHRRGEGGRALLISLVASCVGQFLAIVIFIAGVVPLSQFAVGLLFPELFGVIALGLAAAVGMVGRNVQKGLIAVFIGIGLSLVGPDPITNIPRFTLGISELAFGLSVIPVVVGMLAVREVFLSIQEPTRLEPTSRGLRVTGHLRRDLRAGGWALGVGTVLGVAIGALPGAGAAVATFITYQVVTNLSRDKSEFGRGSVKGLGSVEAANNSAAIGELIPTFGLGIPGGAPMVLVMAALTAQGVIPGPRLLMTEPTLIHNVFGGLMMATVVLAIIGFALIKPSVYMSQLSPPAITTVTTLLVVVGIYSLRWSLFDVWVCVLAGLLGYIMTRYEYPVAPAVLAFMLGPMAEANLRRGLVMTNGWADFLSRPITLVLLLAAISAIVVPVALRAFVRLRPTSKAHESSQQPPES